MNKFIKLFTACLLTICIISCKNISTDPIEGAAQLTNDLSNLAEKNNIQKAHELLSEYWDSYQGENKSIFFFALRNEWMCNDKVVNFIVEPDFKQYPMCGTYMKNLQEVAYKDALANLETAAGGDTSKYNASPAANGILFVSLLANYAETNDKAQAYELIKSNYNHLKKASELSRIEFYASLQHTFKESGKMGVSAFELFRQLDAPIYYDFMKLGLESMLEYN